MQIFTKNPFPDLNSLPSLELWSLVSSLPSFLANTFTDVSSKALFVWLNIYKFKQTFNCQTPLRRTIELLVYVDIHLYLLHRELFLSQFTDVFEWEAKRRSAEVKDEVQPLAHDVIHHVTQATPITLDRHVAAEQYMEREGAKERGWLHFQILSSGK